MPVYVFGNADEESDAIALRVAHELEKTSPSIKYIYANPIDDFLPEKKDIIILDAAYGIPHVVLIEDIDVLKNHTKTTMHDFDLAFTLKLLKKINKIGNVYIIAIPNDYELDQALEETMRILISLLPDNF